MKTNNYKSNFKELVDILLSFNLFLVIFFAVYFLFSVWMQMNSKYIFINIFQKIWNPLIVPLITILIVSSLFNGIISWFRRQVPDSEEDI